MVVPTHSRLRLPPPVRPDLVDVHGTPVAVRRRGVGPALLFLHGAGLAGRWLRFHELLARRADVVAPDQLGCGDTPMPDWLHGFDDLVTHYDDLRRTLGLHRPFDLVGYSFGGWVAAEFAVTYPHLVRALVLIAPVGLAPPDGPPVAVDPFAATDRELIELTMNDLPAVGALPRAARRRGLHADQAAYARLSWRRPYSQRLPRLLRRVTAPALVVVGGADRYVPVEVPRRYHRLLPDSRLAVVEAAGHALVVERTLAVADLVGGFLDGIGSG
ncbi:alpha/beta fold hydrolase [Micromonospora harpali]|uniref:Alpha/beta fold hydrolase n=1 Tax=Micromonospora harpali TaxID=1490225 RepID=A0ABW1HTS5_9ACTN